MKGKRLGCKQLFVIQPTPNLPGRAPLAAGDVVVCHVKRGALVITAINRGARLLLIRAGGRGMTKRSTHLALPILVPSTVISSLFSIPIGSSHFSTILARARSTFTTTGQHLSYTNLTSSTNFPKFPGVYVIHYQDPINKDSVDEVVYIGCAGKIGRNSNLNGRTIGGRFKNGTVPYHFNYQQQIWEFHPKASNPNALRKLPPAQRYRSSLPLAQIWVEVFIFSPAGKFAPSVLESLLLQMFVEHYTKLPLANNAL